MESKKQVQTYNLPGFLSLKSFQQKISSFIRWFKAGDPIPQTHYKSMRIMIALLVFGTIIGSLFVMNLFQIGYITDSGSLFSLGFLTFITLAPGLYALVCTIGCWRRIQGFDWSLIPFFD